MNFKGLLPLLLIALSCAMPVRGATGEKALVLKLKSSAEGPVTITVGKTGIRLDFLQKKFVVVASAPDWKMTMYNPAVKTKFERTLAQLKTVPMFFLKPPKTVVRVVSARADVLDGLPVKMQIADAGFTLTGDVWERPDEKVDRRTVDKMYYLGYNDAKNEVPDMAERFVEALFGLPDNVGLLVACRYRFTTGEKASIVETLSHSYTSCSREQFLPPQGLRLVKTEYDVSSDNRTGFLESWAEQMGLGEPTLNDGRKGK